MKQDQQSLHNHPTHHLTALGLDNRQDLYSEYKILGPEIVSHWLHNKSTENYLLYYLIYPVSHLSTHLNLHYLICYLTLYK